MVYWPREEYVEPPPEPQSAQERLEPLHDVLRRIKFGVELLQSPLETPDDFEAVRRLTATLSITHKKGQP